MNTTPKQVEQVAWQRSLQTIIAWGVTVLTVVAIWVTFSQITLYERRSWWGFTLLFVLQILLAFTIGRSLKELPVAWQWRCRLSFVLSTGLTWLILGIQWVIAPGSGFGFAQVFLLLSMAALGGLIGGLSMTTVEMGLWENNSPPPAQISEDVLQMHKQIIGSGDPVPWAKRGFDLLLAISGLMISTPIWVLSVALIWFEDPGPVLFVKNSVGRGGGNFRQFKLRTMVRGAEENTGPVLADEADGRVLKAGRILRKTALDELPQLINILSGEMSFVGPRPQRTVLVHGYLQYMPKYAERHRVLPGLSGLAQVAGDYYLTPRQKLRFDRLYIRYAGLGYDLLLLFLAFLITFWYRWKPGWNGRLPRRLLHLG